MFILFSLGFLSYPKDTNPSIRSPQTGPVDHEDQGEDYLPVSPTNETSDHLIKPSIVKKVRRKKSSGGRSNKENITPPTGN